MQCTVAPLYQYSIDLRPNYNINFTTGTAIVGTVHYDIICSINLKGGCTSLHKGHPGLLTTMMTAPCLCHSSLPFTFPPLPSSLNNTAFSSKLRSYGNCFGLQHKIKSDVHLVCFSHSLNYVLLHNQRWVCNNDGCSQSSSSSTKEKFPPLHLMGKAITDDTVPPRALTTIYRLNKVQHWRSLTTSKVYLNQQPLCVIIL